MEIKKKLETNFVIGAVTTIVGEQINAKKTGTPIQYDSWKSVLKTAGIGLVGGFFAVITTELISLIRKS